MTQILVPGSSCAVLADSPRSGLLVDGHDYYRAVYDACRQAKRTILMLGWQFDSSVELLRGDEAEDAEHPVALLKFLATLCEQRPELEVRILTWRSSPVFALEREPFQSLTFRLRSHKNLRFELDECHPVGASQHQKAVIVDRSIAFVGGMDLCSGRWDDRAHLAIDPRRGKKPLIRKNYTPYHDVQAYVTGDAVDQLFTWFAYRWEDGCAEKLELPDAPSDPITITPTLEINVPRVGLARTFPEREDWDPPRAAICELHDLHRRAIAAAKRSIYIENQYFCSEHVRRCLFERMMREDEPEPLEIVIVLPQHSGGFKEQISIGVRQSEILRELKMMAARTGHHVGVYYVAAPGDDGDVPVFIHAKVLAVDDRFLLVSSCNTTNRSLGLDSELGVGWESDFEEPTIRNARVELLREHTGMDAAEAAHFLVPQRRLVARLDEIARARTHRLRMHAMDEGGEPGETIAKALRTSVQLDPKDDDAYEDILPDPDHWHRHLKDHLGIAWRRARAAIRR
jgi:phospholipase D1/2